MKRCTYVEWYVTRSLIQTSLASPTLIVLCCTSLYFLIYGTYVNLVPQVSPVLNGINKQRAYVNLAKQRLKVTHGQLFGKSQELVFFTLIEFNSN